MNGTQLQDGTVLAQDDAQAFRDAGYTVAEVRVSCSARLTTDPPPKGQNIVAVDCNGDYAKAAAILHRYIPSLVEPAIGHYGGKQNVSAVANVRPQRLAELHEALLVELPGFRCFAILTQSTAGRTA